MSAVIATGKIVAGEVVKFEFAEHDPSIPAEYRADAALANAWMAGRCFESLRWVGVLNRGYAQAHGLADPAQKIEVTPPAGRVVAERILRQLLLEVADQSNTRYGDLNQAETLAIESLIERRPA